MAERHPREAALRRVHGTGALFSAAYGNVGSSIYYALGLVAVYALGLTPVTFLIAGIIFAFTAATYVEATVLYPEAGGSSSFARHAFNELASFLAAWSQMLTYVVTVAISAFFVPHYLAVFWEPLGEGPLDVLFGIGLVAALAALNIKGTEESARLNLVLAIADLATQVVLVGIGIFLVLDPDLLVAQVDLGSVPIVGRLRARDRGRDGRLHGDRDDLEHGRGGARPDADDPVGHRPHGARRRRPLRAAAGDRALGDARAGGRGRVHDRSSATTYADDPVLGIVENLGLSAGLTDVLRVYVGILAAVILLIATNAALIGLSRLTFSMGQHRQLPELLRKVHPTLKTPYVALIVFSVVAAVVMAPGRRVPRRDLRVRRDALVHGRARLGDQAAQAAPAGRAGEAR